jgi:tetratricopeptide (TPR) repeat protein
VTDGTTSLDAAGGAAPGEDGPLAEGLAAFAARDLLAAHAAFERAHRRVPRAPRAKSWYGVTLVLVEKNITLGISLCDEALRAAPEDPELLLNSARVHLALRQRQRAARAITRGLVTWPEHPALLAAREALGTRRPPVIPFLSRDNPLNRVLGRLRHRWATRNRPVHELTPETLGLPIVTDAPPRS